MKRFLTAIPAFVIFLSVLIVAIQPVFATFSANDLIDDSVFDSSNSMNASQIDSWLNTYFGSTSCISTSHGFAAPNVTGYNPSQGFLYGGAVSAGTVIYNAAQAYHINPQVLLTTLQKEQSLVSGTGGCSVLGDSGAMGYGCPDSGTTHNYPAEGALAAPLFYLNGTPITGVNGTCVNSAAKVGFSQQVIHGAWLLAFGRQRSEGNTGWAVVSGSWNNSDDPVACYGGPMTQGNFKRCSSDSGPTFYDGYTVIDGSSTHMDTGATASLYWYTPHFHGNQNFVTLFTNWFGSPTGPCEASGDALGGQGSSIIRYNVGGVDRLAYTQLNKTGSQCVEVHVWNKGFSTWLTNIATGMRATNPSNGVLVASRSKVDSQSSINFITVGNTEVHRFSPNLQKIPGYYDVAANLSSDTTRGTFISGDFFGNGSDYLAYILHAGSNGGMEIHVFNQGMTQAVGFYDLPTDIGAVNNGAFVAGDFLGRGYSQLAYVSYGNTEVHLFDIRNGRGARIYEVPTNLTGTSPATGTFVAGDFLGSGHAQLVYVIYSNGVNRVETHMFDTSLTRVTGTQDVITNLAGFSP